MAPEQALGKTDQIGPPADVWALGVILYRCLVGQLPFVGDSMLQTLELVRSAEPAAPRQRVPGVPADLEAICLRCLDKDPARRPTAGELATALEHFLALGPQPITQAPHLPASHETRNLRHIAFLLGATEAPHLPASHVPSAPPEPTRRRIAIQFRGCGIVASIVVTMCLLVLVGAGSGLVWLLNDLGPDGVASREHAGERKPRADKRQSADGPALAVKRLRVEHYMMVGKDRAQLVGTLGNELTQTRFGDAVRIEVALTTPGYAYLLAFNADGSEQLLWPVGPKQTPDPTVRPPRVARIDYPARKNRWFVLDDEPAGGLQAFAAVISRRPLPSYEAWRKQRGPAAWKKLPAGRGVWAADSEGTYPMREAVIQRGAEGDLPGTPPLDELCRSLQKAGAEKVEALAFPVLPKEE
jgi:hypothetical protein